MFKQNTSGGKMSNESNQNVVQLSFKPHGDVAPFLGNVN